MDRIEAVLAELVAVASLTNPHAYKAQRYRKAVQSARELLAVDDVDLGRVLPAVAKPSDPA